MINETAWRGIKQELDEKGIVLVAVSKTKPAEDVKVLYNLGQRDFGENYVQELTEKQPQLPADIRWHYIGHLQSNKVKYIAPFVHLIHAVDSMKLIEEINKQAVKNDRIIDILLQVYIAAEETKFGLDRTELRSLLKEFHEKQSPLTGVRIRGLMGMASFTEDVDQVRAEFQQLSGLFTEAKRSWFSDQSSFDTCSMGMSGDYKIALEEGSTMVRIGSLLFGARG